MNYRQKLGYTALAATLNSRADEFGNTFTLYNDNERTTWEAP